MYDVIDPETLHTCNYIITAKDRTEIICRLLKNDKFTDNEINNK